MRIKELVLRARRTIVDRVLYPLGFRGWPLRRAFVRIYRRNAWQGAESVSGTGSDLASTAAIRSEIPRLVDQLGIRTILDAPCGDFHWMREVNLNGVQYTGVDVVDALIAKNQEQFGSATRRFLTMDITADQLPRVDLILCRECLVHLPFKHVIAALRNFKRSRATYLLTTTFPAIKGNSDVMIGHWRPINLQLPPFNLGDPLRLINEHYAGPNGEFTDKSLGLWMLRDLSL